MLLQGKTVLVYQGVENKTSKAGNEYTLVWFGDPVKYQRFNFFKSDDLDLSSVNEGDRVVVQVEAEVRGYSTNFNLKSIHKVDK